MDKKKAVLKIKGPVQYGPKKDQDRTGPDRFFGLFPFGSPAKKEE